MKLFGDKFEVGQLTKLNVIDDTEYLILATVKEVKTNEMTELLIGTLDTPPVLTPIVVMGEINNFVSNKWANNSNVKISRLPSKEIPENVVDTFVIFANSLPYDFKADGIRRLKKFYV